MEKLEARSENRGAERLLVRAFAKLNLCLEVLGRRNDGYHEIRTVMQAIDLADDIEVTSSTSLQVYCDNPSLEGENNLVWNAAIKMAESCGRLPLVDIKIRKGIPVGMGLGGGSSDAASVIIALDELWQLRYSTGKLADIGSTLGSDVPFFVCGGAALASGRGQIIDPLPTRVGLGATVICPEKTVESKTARMYSRLSQQRFSDGGITQQLVQGILMGQYYPDLFYNVFEDVAFQEFPQLEEVCRTVEKASGRRPHLTGSGPSMYLFPSSLEEKKLVNRALQPCGAQAYFVHTLGRTQGIFVTSEDS